MPDSPFKCQGIESTVSLSSVSSSPQLSLSSPAPSAFGRTLPNFDGNAMASATMQLSSLSFFLQLLLLTPGDHVWANSPDTVGSQRPEIFRPPWSANWGDPIPSYNWILPVPSPAHQFTIPSPFSSPVGLGVPLSPNGLFSPLPTLFPSPTTFFPMGTDLLWLVAWKPEKPEAVGDVIQKPMVRAGGLVTNVLAEENYTQGRGRKNVFSDSRVEFSGFVDVKVFVYELPSECNEDWLVKNRCASHLFAAEVAIHRALLNSSVRMFDPQEADFFFVPVYVSCNFSTKNGFSALGHTRPLLGSSVRYISETMPFWNRSGGSDHVFAATHDYGACFHAMEDVAICDGIPEFLQNSIILQTFGVKGKHHF